MFSWYFCAWILTTRNLQALFSTNPNWIVQSLIALLAGLHVPFVTTENHELGEEIVASYLYQVHLYHWLETNDYGRFLADKDL